jgi:LysM repeat protein/murein endopeptidase
MPSVALAGKTAKKAPCNLAYVVTAGDTLSHIASTTGYSVRQLKSYNHLKNDRIRVNQELQIPGCGTKSRVKKLKNGPRMYRLKHRVKKGETVGRIAKNYGVTLKSIRQLNKIRNDRIRVGKILDVRATLGTARSRVYEYTIRPGDTLTRIARRFEIDWRDIRKMNGNRKRSSLRIGDKIKLLIEGNGSRSEAWGRPTAGKLRNGEQLQKGPGYYRRRPYRAWGTTETIAHILTAIASVRARYPRVHDLAIGDISAKRGGHLNPHVSHQTGRDVDLGFYFKGERRAGPKAFVSAIGSRLDYEATWELITALIGKNKRKSPVQYIFLNYEVQRMMYTWAREKGISKRKLDWMFQYPHGKRAMHGLIRHSSGHKAHMHVRFRCPKNDKKCRN